MTTTAGMTSMSRAIRPPVFFTITITTAPSLTSPPCPDSFMANGHLSPEIDSYHIDTVYAQRKLLYRNVPSAMRDRTFRDVSTSSGPGIQLVSSSRGIALADYDNDGDVDIAINNMNGPACLLRNDGGNASHWIEITTIGRQSNRDGIGARAEVRTGAQRQID